MHGSFVIPAAADLEILLVVKWLTRVVACCLLNSNFQLPMDSSRLAQRATAWAMERREGEDSNAHLSLAVIDSGVC